MSGIDREVNQLIEAILNSQEYNSYRAEMENLKGEPGLKERIDEFRRRNFELQNGGDCDFAKLDQLEREYEDMLQQPRVAAFLDAELNFCRMIQDMNSYIATAVRFE